MNNLKRDGVPGPGFKDAKKIRIVLVGFLACIICFGMCVSAEDTEIPASDGGTTPAITPEPTLADATATASDGNPSVAAMDAGFLAYQNQALLSGNRASAAFQTVEILNDDGSVSHVFVTGAIPSPVDMSHTVGQYIQSDSAVQSAGESKSAVVAASGLYPSSYDLRTLGKVSSVKDQGSAGSCWAFATYGSLESTLLTGEFRDFSENHLKNTLASTYTDGFDRTWDGGGNAGMSTAYLTRYSGPVLESADPYSDTSGASPAGLTPANHVQTVYYLPVRSSPADNDNIKYALTNQGGVMTSLYWAGSYYNATPYAFYNSGTSSINHAITLVGWDDTYSRYNFTSTPAGDGAFIARNSWGSSWGDGGYFYISYYDLTVGNYCFVFTGDPVSNYDRVYSYDPLGWTTSLGYGSTTAWYANIFTSQSAETLKAVGFYTPTGSTGYTVKIYRSPNSGPINTTALAATTSGTLSSPGYHTVTVPDVALAAGQRYSIVVAATTPGYTYPIPMEYPVADYSSHATSHAGESYIGSSGTSWSDLTTFYPNANVCLKGYTKATVSTALPVASFTADRTSGTIPLSVRFNDTSSNSPTGWLWVFGDGSTSVVQNATHTYSAAGTYTVNLTATNAAGSNSREVAGFISASLPAALPVASFTADRTSGTIPLSVQFNDTSSNSPTGWLWVFGDGSTSVVQNATHTYSAAGTYTVNLTATNAAGSSTREVADFISASLPAALPVANFITNITSGPAPLTVRFTDTSTGSPTAWNYSFGNGRYSKYRNMYYAYTTGGIYTVNLTVTNASGSNTLSRTDYIRVTPGASFTTNITNGPAPLTVRFTDTSTGNPTAWNYSFGNGRYSRYKAFYYTYTTGGVYTVNLTASNAAGNTTITKTDYIRITPGASFTTNITSGPAPLTVRFTDTSTGNPTAWNYSFGNGRFSKYKNMVYTYTAGGVYTVNLTATNAAGNNTITRTNYITVS